MVSQKGLMVIIAIVVVVVGAVYVASATGVLSPVSKPQAEDKAATPEITASEVGVQQQITTVNLRTFVRESIADTTGVKNGIAGNMSYYYDGAVQSFDNFTTATTGYTSSTSANRPDPNVKVFGTFQAAGYYTTKVATFPTKYASSMDIAFDVDRLNTLSLAMQNTTSGDWQVTGMKQVLGTDVPGTLDIRLTGATPRGVYRNPLFCLDYDTNNFTKSGTYVVNAEKLAGVPSGVAGGFEECFISNIDSVRDVEDQFAKIRLTPVSGVNPDTNVTVRVIDLGTFTKASNGVLFEGYENSDTNADVSATNYDFVVDVD